MHVFLVLNGFDLDADPDEAMGFVVPLYDAHALRFERLEPWLRNHVILRKP